LGRTWSLKLDVAPSQDAAAGAKLPLKILRPATTSTMLKTAKTREKPANPGQDSKLFKENSPRKIYFSWLVVSTPLKNMKVSWDDDIPNRWKKTKMFQTTNQAGI
jgi:hypothetical protein